MEFRMTPSQQNFYTGGMGNDTILWNQGGIVLFAARYSHSRLNAALNRLVEVHDGLRLRITEGENGPVSRIAEFVPEQFPRFTFTSREQLLEAAGSFVNTPFDPAGALYRCAVFQTPEQSGILVCAHHILIDGYSTQVMADFICGYLKGNTDGSAAPQSYACRIEEEVLYHSSKRCQRDRQYWLEKFSGGPTASVFSTEGGITDHAAAELEAPLPPELMRRINVLCAEAGISASSFFTTVLAVYIRRKTGLTRFSIGTPVLNRTTAAQLNSIGLYMHILPLVAELTDGSFLENAINMEDSKMTLFRHQKFTQTGIRSLLQDQGPLFDVILDCQAFPQREDYELVFRYSSALSVPLEIHLHSFGTGDHRLKLRYQTGRFSAPEAGAMLSALRHMAAAAAARPGTGIRELPLYDPADLERMILRGRTASYGLPENGATICGLFEETAQKQPGRICLTAGGRSMTFGQLHAGAAALDRRIRSVTRGRKSVIAVIARRSVEMYTAIYAAIRGGSAYLPISPEDPQERIRHILRDSGAALVLAQRECTALSCGVPCIDVTEFLAQPPVHSPLPCAALPDDTAYVIYTSGSTGSPKGARISHRSAVNRILWMQEAYPLGPSGVILQKTPYTFDVSVWEIFWWGMCGGSLTASRPGEHFLPAKILAETAAGRVTHLHFVPSVFDLFLTYLETHPGLCADFGSVRHVFLSGEALSATLVRRFYRLFSYDRVRLHNLYGPTECAVDVTFYDCVPDETDPVPIGRPIHNTSVCILDPGRNPLPEGVRGELCIGGVNVGQGYLNNPGLTAVKFIPDPFSGGTLYRTGDLAYIRGDGQLIFCGRMDSQIKLNGQRVEPGEIESVIRTMAGVEAAAVIPITRNGRRLLAACCCGSGLSEEALRAYCEKHLPGYMVPALIRLMESLPLNPSGKLDRKALEASLADVHPPQLREPPRNEAEARICHAFSDVLGVAEVGRGSDFFALGGSSLSMIALLSQDGFRDLSAADFIANPTPAALAAHLARRSGEEGRYVTPLLTADSAKALVCFPYAGGGAEAFAALVKAVSREPEPYCVYFVEFPRSRADCAGAAEELRRLAMNKELYFYSHCAGSAAALQIINLLEEHAPGAVRHYFAGGSIPPETPWAENPWNSVPDEMLERLLRKGGASFEDLQRQQINDMLARFRRDTDFMTAFHAQKPVRIHCPLSVIVSPADLFTPNCADARRLWENHAMQVVQVCHIDAASHYFQSDNADALLRILRETIGS